MSVKLKTTYSWTIKNCRYFLVSFHPFSLAVNRIHMLLNLESKIMFHGSQNIQKIVCHVAWEAYSFRWIIGICMCACMFAFELILLYPQPRENIFFYIYKHLLYAIERFVVYQHANNVMFICPNTSFTSEEHNCRAKGQS